jgi:hypothetical protein
MGRPKVTTTPLTPLRRVLNDRKICTCSLFQISYTCFSFLHIDHGSLDELTEEKADRHHHHRDGRCWQIDIRSTHKLVSELTLTPLPAIYPEPRSRRHAPPIRGQYRHKRHCELSGGYEAVCGCLAPACYMSRNLSDQIQPGTKRRDLDCAQFVHDEI